MLIKKILILLIVFSSHIAFAQHYACPHSYAKAKTPAQQDRNSRVRYEKGQMMLDPVTGYLTKRKFIRKK